MIKSDARDGCSERGLDHVRCVKPTSDPNLQHRDLDAASREGQKGSRRKGFEQAEGRHLLMHCSVEHLREGLVVKRFAIDLNAFVEAAEVRRCVETRPNATLAQNRLEHRGHAAFAVRTGNVNDGKTLLRCVEEGQSFLDAVEPEACSTAGQFEEAGELGIETYWHR